VGLDFSEAMLGVAAARAARAAAGRSFQAPRFVRGDAQQLPFEEGSFDIVTVGYGLRNLASWEAGVREMQRVAKAGGRLAVLDFGKPEQRVWRGLYFAYLRLAVPWLGRAFAGSAAAYAYIHESLVPYPAPAEMAERLRRLGLAKVEVISLLGGVMAIHTAEKHCLGPAKT
jgi:demethylmenaquinone methyltransferase/2-methoxy-6-polyprenyl-1,4-benzoquinol methylase